MEDSHAVPPQPLGNMQDYDAFDDRAPEVTEDFYDIPEEIAISLRQAIDDRVQRLLARYRAELDAKTLWLQLDVQEAVWGMNRSAAPPVQGATVPMSAERRRHLPSPAPA